MTRAPLRGKAAPPVSPRPRTKPPEVRREELMDAAARIFVAPHAVPRAARCPQRGAHPGEEREDEAIGMATPVSRKGLAHALQAFLRRAVGLV